jgi:hypothetical protein
MIPAGNDWSSGHSSCSFDHLGRLRQNRVGNLDGEVLRDSRHVHDPFEPDWLIDREFTGVGTLPYLVAKRLY